MRILIATATKFNDASGFASICKIMRDSAAEGGLTIPPGILFTSGPGCNNLAFDLLDGDDENCERFANQLTMALMPSKWSTTKDELPSEDTCEVRLSFEAFMREVEYIFQKAGDHMDDYEDYDWQGEWDGDVPPAEAVEEMRIQVKYRMGM